MTPNIWTRTLDYQLRTMGSQWTTTLDGEQVTFSAIMDDEEVYDIEEGRLKDKSRVVTVTMLTSVAKRLPDNHPITDEHDTIYKVRERTKQADGALTLCRLIEVSTNDC